MEDVMKEYLKHDQKSDWDQDVPSGPLLRGGPAKIAVDVFRVAMVVAVGLAILPFKILAALAGGGGGPLRGTSSSVWDAPGQDDPEGSLYLDPITGEYVAHKTYHEQKPFEL